MSPLGTFLRAGVWPDLALDLELGSLDLDLALGTLSLRLGPAAQIAFEINGLWSLGPPVPDLDLDEAIWCRPRDSVL